MGDPAVSSVNDSSSSFRSRTVTAPQIFDSFIETDEGTDLLQTGWSYALRWISRRGILSASLIRETIQDGREPLSLVPRIIPLGQKILVGKIQIPLILVLLIGPHRS